VPFPPINLQFSALGGLLIARREAPCDFRDDVLSARRQRQAQDDGGSAGEEAAVIGQCAVSGAPSGLFLS